MNKIISIVALFLLGACSRFIDSPSKVYYRTTTQLQKKIKMRFVEGQLARADLGCVLKAVNKAQNVKLDNNMFKLTENIDLLTSKYSRYVLTINDIPSPKSTIRIWQDKNTQQLIQAEVILQAESNPAFESAQRDFSDVLPVVQKELAADFSKNRVKALITEHVWMNGKLTRLISLKTGRGKHEFYFSNINSKIVKKVFRPFELSDTATSFDANLYKIWEWANDGYSGPVLPSELQARQILRVNNIQNFAYLPTAEQLQKAENTVLLGTNYKQSTLSDDEIAQGKWNRTLTDIWFPKFFSQKGIRIANDFGNGNAVKLTGKNVSVFAHPDAVNAASFGINTKAPYFLANESAFGEDTKTTFKPAYWGLPAYSVEDFTNRKALDDNGNPRVHDTKWLMQNGFDELQVYYAVDVFLESMRNLGFQDPVMSAIPFAAVLYNPDITMVDNAYYDDNAINFTTYSENLINYARDNTTIWHELGHGIMDRVMGSHVDAIEGYGLWEGIADLMAELLVVDQAGREDFQGRDRFRINNKMWLNNSNESHDDGESYGGVMFDMLQLFMNRFGEREGLLRMSDLVYETMRLTRDHNEITPVEWFEHLKYADSLPRIAVIAKRVPGELLADINVALEKRNYNITGKPARMWISYQGNEITEDTIGSRYQNVQANVSDINKQYLIDIHVDDGDNKQFSYPVTVKVKYNGGPLQGAINWTGEENGDLIYTITASGQTISVPLALAGKCDAINTEEGTCSDFVYMLLYNSSDANAKPVAKKRVYVNFDPNK